MEEATNNQGNGSKRIYLAIIALLLLINGVAGYLLYVAGYLLYNENKQKEEKITLVQQKDTEIQSMTHQLDSTRAQLESQKGHNNELDSIINEKQALIDKTKGELVAAQRRGNLSEAEKKKYKDLVAKYEADNQELQKEIQDLTAKNQALTAENLQVSHNLEVEKHTTASLTEDKNKLSKKVELGSLLHLQNLTVTGEKKKKNGKEITEKSAKKTDFIKISFETGDNKVLEKGDVKLYIRIINPKGETIALADQGSGTIKLADGGGDVQFSRQIDIDWDQTSQKKEIEWSQNIKEPGTYKVEVYQSGYLVGNASVLLK
jgi:predicted RNase H-like nuclease (RuvC/YqgF family)